MKKIFMIGYMHPKNDKRVERSVKALEKKFEVKLQYLQKNDVPINDGQNMAVYLQRSDKKNILSRKTDSFFLLRKFDRKILEEVTNGEYDILYIHGISIFYPLKLFRIAKKRGKKVVFDMHEYYPQDYLSYLKKPLSKIKEYLYEKLIFKKQLKLSDMVISVSKGISQHIYSKNLYEQKIYYLPNYASYCITSNDEQKKEKSICFVGGTSRSIKTVLPLLKALSENGFSVKIIGTHIEGFESLGFLSYQHMMEKLSESMFSLIAYDFDPKMVEYAHSMPNKFFDSICAGTPVMVDKRFKSMASEVNKYGVGHVIDIHNVSQSINVFMRSSQKREYERILNHIAVYRDDFFWNREKEKKYLNELTKQLNMEEKR